MSVGKRREGRGGAFTIVEVVVVVSMFLVMIAILAPFVRMTKMRANRVKCSGNLMQISLGLHKYAVDHDGAFPGRLSELYPNYIEDEGTFDCPASKRRGGKDAPGYDYVAGLSESSPIKEVIVQDSPGSHKKSGKNILRINGSVDWVSGKN